MKVQLKHHYGYVTYNMPGSTSLGEAAMAAVRKSHDFLDEEYAGQYEMETDCGNALFVRVFHLPRSEAPPQAACTPAIFRKSPGDPWFTVEYCPCPEEFGDGHIESDSQRWDRLKRQESGA